MAKRFGQIQAYVIGTPHGPQSIGVANDATLQCIMFQMSNLTGLQVLYTIDIERDSALKIEQYVYGILEDKRVHGAWFDVRPDQAIAALDAAHHALLRGEL